MQIIEQLIFNLVFMPLLGSVAAYFGGKKLGDNFAKSISCILLIVSALFSWIVFYKVIFVHNIYQIKLFNFIELENFKTNWTLYIDSLTSVMLVVITNVSAVVHLYSIGYMKEDESIPRFMSYLSLFTFFMLMLVTSNNIIQLFFGWEGVGLCSYLLIGFWYNKESANIAAMKAFIVNRVGDFAFMVGIALLYFVFDSVNFQEIFANKDLHLDLMFTIFSNKYRAIDIICLLLFIGAMGKSAQIGLHTWLPDAMEGPTPVSALIHAATMVTAGVFLVVRFSPVFNLSPGVLEIITYTGSITAIFAASIALVQTDIKKIIAYSTCSQLGYMFFACGVGAYQVAIFHLMTHAFFKALLFLASGNVIHACHHEQDIMKMGGLAKKLPVTYALMTIGSLALAGIYPLAGYFSKDLILEHAYASGSSAGMTAFLFGLITAGLTAFYSWRLLFITFHGKTKFEKKHFDNIHEVPKIMTYPLFLLAFGAIFSGIVAEKFGILGAKFWNNSLILGVLQETHELNVIKLLPLLAAISGIFFAYLFYIKSTEIPKAIAHSFKPLYILLKNKYYFDQIYNYIFVNPIKYISHYVWHKGDMLIIDGYGPNGLARLCQRISGLISKLQSGYVYNYALVMIIGMLFLLTWYTR